MFTGVRPASGALQPNRWNKVNLPAEGETGGWALAAGSDIKLLTSAPDGTLYAYAAGLADTLMKSSDGLKWAANPNVHDAMAAITVSGHDSKIVYYAANSTVYRSADAGKTFSRMPPLPGAGSPTLEITSLAADGGFIAVGMRDTAGGSYGGVYLLDESLIVPAWVDTGIGNYDVYAVALPLDFTAFHQIIAVVNDETDTWVFSKLGAAAWNTLFPPTRLQDRDGLSVAATRSSAIAFPQDYSSVSPNDFYIAVDTGTGSGGVYKISSQDAGIFTAVNLNAALNGAAADFTSLAVYKENETTVILSGTSNGQAFVSTDSGASWTKNRKAPTGGADAYVLFPASFPATHLMYAATSGTGSAVSISRDAGLTWNQVSLIDTSLDTIVSIAVSPEYNADKTLFLDTFGIAPDSGALWRTSDCGVNWECIFSGASPGVDLMSGIALPPEYGPECQTIFVSGTSSGDPVIWSSDDNGQTFRARFTHDPADGTPFLIDTLTAADKNTLFVGSHDFSRGLVFRSNNKGLFYNSAAYVGTNTIYSLALSPDFAQDGSILTGNTNGQVYYSSDAGMEFRQLSANTDSGTLSGDITVAFAPDFPQSRLIYIASDTPDAGLFRFKLDESEEWQSIDATLPSGGVIGGFSISGSGTVYAAGANTGGSLERCLDSSAAAPVFETVTAGLNSNAALFFPCLSGNRLWAADTVNNRLMTYEDTLASAVILAAPEKNVSGLGTLGDHAVDDIALAWESMLGASGYEWQCARDGDFSNIVSGLQGTVTGTSVRLPSLAPSAVYTWRVRVSSPCLSPWSEKRTFATSVDTRVIELQPESPAAGASGVSVQPVFQWTAVVGASSYELLVAGEVEFSHPVIIKMNEYALPSNAWECDVKLDYSKTYYWKVRAISAGSYSQWSATGVFTTVASLIPALPTSTLVPEVRLLGKPDTQMDLNPVQSAPVLPPSAPTSGAAVTAPGSRSMYELAALPEWLIYFIGGLLVIVVLALVIILAVVLKIKRF